MNGPAKAMVADPGDGEQAIERLNRALDKFAAEESSRERFIDRAYAGGRRLGCDDEIIRQHALSVLQTHPRFRAPLPNNNDQRIFEDRLAERYPDRIPQSTANALNYILGQPNPKPALREFIRGRSKRTLQNIQKHIRESRSEQT
jgi:hypothetical protein